jgi:hypothetical protein
MKSLRYMLSDGSHALLHAIVQTANYRREYLQTPTDAEEEIKRLAKLQLSAEWRSAPLILLSPGKAILAEQIRTRSLPTVMCVGEFLSYRGDPGPRSRPIYKYIAWLQDEMEPHMDATNREHFSKLDWDSKNENGA